VFAAAGELVISPVVKADDGEYVCVATNIAGEKKSAPVTLTVLGTSHALELAAETSFKRTLLIEGDINMWI